MSASTYPRLTATTLRSGARQQPCLTNWAAVRKRQKAYTTGTTAILDEIAVRLKPDDPDSAKGTALALFTMLVGSMQLARAVDDAELSDTVLEQGFAMLTRSSAAGQRRKRPNATRFEGLLVSCEPIKVRS